MPIKADTASDLPDLLSVKQVASELHLSSRAVVHRIAAGTLAAIKLGPGTSAYVITRAEVERAKGEAPRNSPDAMEVSA